MFYLITAFAIFMRHGYGSSCAMLCYLLCAGAAVLCAIGAGGWNEIPIKSVVFKFFLFIFFKKKFTLYAPDASYIVIFISLMSLRGGGEQWCRLSSSIRHHF